MAISALGDQPLNEAARWVDSPNDRGTFNIISNCVLTLVLCVWTSIHLNIPAVQDGASPGSIPNAHREEKVDAPFSWKKIKYVILALIMPEVVAAVAFNQWLEQRSLMNFINKETEMGRRENLPPKHEKRRLPDEEVAEAAGDAVAATSTSMRMDPQPIGKGQDNEKVTTHASESTPPRVSEEDKHNVTPQGASHQPTRSSRPWTYLHCWYAMMGGFVIEKSSLASSSHDFPFPNGITRLTLTSDAIKKLSVHYPDIFPAVRASEIADKSKSSELAKLIVCTQVAWFIINIIGRVAQSMPLTVLELNTAAHCLCTFVTYVFWWHKPLDIVQPSVVNLTEEAAAMVANMCMRSSQVSWLLRDMDLYSDARWWKRFAGYFGNVVDEAQDLKSGNIIVISPEEASTFKLCVVQEEAQRTSRWIRVHHRLEDLSPDELSRATHDTSNNLARIYNYDSLLHLITLAETHQKANPSESWDLSAFCTEYLALANPNHPFTNVKGIATGTTGLSFVCACGLYALVHAAAWNGPFRSHVELYLWRMGVLAFVPLLILTPIIFLALWRRENPWTDWNRLFQRPVTMVQSLKYDPAITRSSWALQSARTIALLIPVLVLEFPKLILRLLVSRATIFVYVVFAMLGFLTGRAFLVVEAFLALPYAPDGVFEQPDWFVYLPHFG
ncbi:hypothetical protein CC79DRAFT_1328290 [Sarocladium strictum]